MRRGTTALGPVRIGYKAPRSLPSPAAPRWDLRCAKARLWNEHIDKDVRGAWQLEDERHMSPEFDTFTGYQTRSMRPGLDSMARAKAAFNTKLPNHSAWELQSRRDVPFQTNVMFGKEFYETTFYGTSVPYKYRMFKQFGKANRNDRKVAQNKFRIIQGQGQDAPPEGFQPIADEGEDEEE